MSRPHLVKLKAAHGPSGTLEGQTLVAWAGYIKGDGMRIKHIARLIQNLRLANEVQAAASMDVEDAKANCAFYQRKLDATEARRKEASAAVTEAEDLLSDAVIQETQAPLMLMIECERNAR